MRIHALEFKLAGLNPSLIFKGFPPPLPISTGPEPPTRSLAKSWVKGCEWEAIPEPAGPSVPQNRSGVWHRPGAVSANRNHLLGLCFELYRPLPPWAEEYRTPNPRKGWVLPWMGPAHPRHSLQGCLQGRDGSTISSPLNCAPHICLPPHLPTRRLTVCRLVIR